MLPGHLSTKQIIILSCFTVYGTIFFTLPRILAQAAGHTGWLSILIGSLLSVPMIWLISRVGGAMDEKNLIGHALHVFGPVIGRLFALLLLLPLLLVSAMTVRIISELFVALLLPETPLELIILMLLLLRCYLIKDGMRAVAQWGEIVLPGVVLLMAVLFTLSLNDVELQRITPYFTSSFSDVFRGSLGICSLFSEMILLLFIYPSIKHKHHMFRIMLWCVVVVTLLFEVTFFLTLGTYGSAYTQRLTFPVVEMIKDIDIFEFIEHLESPFIAAWVFINVTKGSFTLYASCVGFQEWFGTQTHRSLIVPMAVIVFYCALIPGNIYQSIVEFEAAKGLIFCVYALVILLLLWAAGKLKTRRSRNDCSS
ncbi:endospore germination permease [Paenibacillus oryzisoli]|uniref:GerAB/ArcD/ProY family transporter n=1 Tax=Paenibacillus oryzisoli TaxID=1850517 RepID=UPI003D279AEE